MSQQSKKATMRRVQTKNDNGTTKKPPKKVDSSTKTWSPYMDNVVEMPINKKDKNDFDRQIHDTLYSEKEIRRLSLFEKICPQEIIKNKFNVII